MLNETPAQTAAFFSAKAASFYVKFAQAASDAGREYYLSQAHKYERFAAAAAQRAFQDATQSA